MKNKNILFGSIFLLLVAIGSYFLLDAQMTSLYAYRSLLHNNPPEAGKNFDWAEENPITRRVVFILVDALRNDTSLDPNLMPTLDQLREKGAWATSHSQQPSYSAPGYSVIGTGAWQHLNDGPVMNLDYEEIPTWTQDNLFSAVHRAGLKTAISSYDWFEKLVPQNDVDASFYTPDYDAAADVEVVNAALPWIESGEYQLIFIHLDQVDTAGHLYGGKSPEWDEAAARVDAHIAEIASLLDFEQDTLIITSDHGQLDRGGHGGHEAIVLTEPLIMVGAGINPGQYPDTEMVDIAPTLSVLLGANIPATSQGHVLFDWLTLSEAEKSTVAEALVEQQRKLHAAYVDAIGTDEPLPIRETDMEFVTGTNFAINAMLIRGQDHDRQMRFNTTLFIALIPAYFIFRSWKKIKWLAAAAFAYLLLFNIYYAFIARRTYSLSSVRGFESLVSFNAFSTLAIFGTIWLVFMLKSSAFKKGAQQTAEETLILTFLTLYLFALPVLWSYGVNGLTTGWYLPDFPILFRGFLALLQSIMIALSGFLLMGIGALIGKLQAQRG